MSLNTQCDLPQQSKLEIKMFRNIVKKYGDWKHYRDTYAELSRLSNRELDDLGIARHDIKSIAQRKPFSV